MYLYRGMTSRNVNSFDGKWRPAAHKYKEDITYQFVLEVCEILYVLDVPETKMGFKVIVKSWFCQYFCLELYIKWGTKKLFMDL